MQQKTHDAIQDTIRKNIAKYGWHSFGIFPTKDDSPDKANFTYTVGLREKGFPELIIIGLPNESAHALIGDAIKQFERNGVPKDGQVDATLANMPLVYREVPTEEAAKEHTCWVGNYYKNNDYKVIQIVWPDRAGLLPWEPGCDARMAMIQSEIVDWRRDALATPVH